MISNEFIDHTEVKRRYKKWPKSIDSSPLHIIACNVLWW